jgi:beta-hydroxylase
MSGNTLEYEVPVPTNWEGRLIPAIVGWIERRIARDSRVGHRPVFDNALFPWIRELEAATPQIRAELDEVMRERELLPGFHEIVRQVDTITQDRLWQTFMFCGYGRKSQENLRRCPATAAALRNVPGLQTAFFSILSPGKHIPPHRGPYNGVLRLHLGLIVPQPRERCWIRVHDRTLHWQEGRALVIDDSFHHEVRNDTDGYRVVLFLDFERPCRWPAKLFNRLILAYSRVSPEINDAMRKQRRWELMRRRAPA